MLLLHTVLYCSY